MFFSVVLECSGLWKLQFCVVVSSLMLIMLVVFLVICIRWCVLCVVIDIWFFWLVEVGIELMLVGQVCCLFFEISVVVVICGIMKLEFRFGCGVRNVGRLDSVGFISIVRWCLLIELILYIVIVSMLVVKVIGFVWKLLLDNVLLVLVNISGLLEMLLVLIFSVVVVWCRMFSVVFMICGWQCRQYGFCMCMLLLWCDLWIFEFCISVCSVVVVVICLCWSWMVWMCGLNGVFEFLVVFIDSVLVISVVWNMVLILNRLVSVQVVENCVLLSSVRFFFVFSLIGCRLVCVSVLIVGMCLLLMKVLFMFSIMLVRCESGVRLFEVFIEFCVGIMGNMFLISIVLSSSRVFL